MSAEDFARCVTAVRRAMVSDDAETFPPGSPAYEHAGLAFDAYHRALSPPRRSRRRSRTGPCSARASPRGS